MKDQIKVLIADDHQVIIDGVKSILSDNDKIQVVDTATDGQKALEIVQTNFIDVAIIDINMPIMDGIELSRVILKNHPATKIVLLTMIGDGEFIYEAKRMGIQAYILKEKSSETLLDAIHSVARGGSYWPIDLYDRMVDKKGLSPKKNSNIKFTRKQKEILQVFKENPSLTSGELGEILNITPTTVDTHFRNMMRKSGTKKRIALLDFATS